MLAHLKAEAVARRLPEKLVVGSDQVLELEGRVLRKPRDRREARRQIRALAGRVHWLHTAVALYRIEPKLRRSALESVALRVRPMGRREIEAYLDTNEWQGCAGGYRVEGQGIKLLESVRGDYHAVVGLPMLRLIRMLRDAGFALF
jgi:septum formation protein